MPSPAAAAPRVEYPLSICVVCAGSCSHTAMGKTDEKGAVEAVNDAVGAGFVAAAPTALLADTSDAANTIEPTTVANTDHTLLGNESLSWST